MFGSEILDVAVGLILVYLLVSIICTAVREGIETWLKTRAAYLEHGIRQLLQDREGKGLAKDLFNHPLIFGLFTSDAYTPGANRNEPNLTQTGRGMPSYIPSKNFATALLDIAARGPVQSDTMDARNATPITLESIRHGAADIQNANIRRVLLTAVDTAQGDLDKAQKSIEDWYDSSMDRVSGWYKRSTQKMILVIGLLVAMAMNIDSLAIIGDLYKTDATRAALVAAAGKEKGNETAAQAETALANLHLPIGWSKKVSPSLQCPKDWMTGFVFPWIGWILTAIAASLGAPFWFDVLNKVMVIRSTVKPREKSPEEGSEDRQPKNPVPAPPPAPPPAAAPPVAPGPAVAAAPPPGPAGPGADDAIDGCDVLASAATTLTSDDQLPVTEGGVA